MKVLLLGAAGQVGSAVLRASPREAVVVPVSRQQLDITDAKSVRDLLDEVRPDVVVNAAAYTAVDKAESEPDRARAVNSLAVRDLADAAAAAGIFLVHISTDFVFDGRSGSPYRPGDTPNPLGVYACTKAEGEKAVLEVKQGKNLVVRTAWVYASGHRNFVHTMLALMAERDSVQVVDDQIGTPTHARSLADALWRMILGGATGILHFTDSGVASWYDFAVAIQEEAIALGLLARAVPVRPVPTSAYPTAARRPAFSVLDTTDTSALVGGPPPHWRVELRKMLQEDLSYG